MARPQVPPGLICHILWSFDLQCLLGGFPEEVSWFLLEIIN